MSYTDMVKEREDAVAAQALFERIVAEDLKGSYDLIYIDYRDGLSEEQAGFIVAGDYERLWESFESWEPDSRADGVQWEIDELCGHLSVEDQRLFGLIADDVRLEIGNRDSGAWVRELIRNTPDPLLRVPAVSEDDAGKVDRDDPGTVLDIVGFARTEANLEAVAKVLRETPSDVLMGYWIFRVDLEHIYALRDEDDILVVNPHLVMGNPFTGAYTCDIQRLEGAVVVPRADLRTDKDAFGYSCHEVYGGLGGDFDSEIRVIEKEA